MDQILTDLQTVIDTLVDLEAQLSEASATMPTQEGADAVAAEADAMLTCIDRLTQTIALLTGADSDEELVEVAPTDAPVV